MVKDRQEDYVPDGPKTTCWRKQTLGFSSVEEEEEIFWQ